MLLKEIWKTRPLSHMGFINFDKSSMRIKSPMSPTLEELMAFFFFWHTYNDMTLLIKVLLCLHSPVLPFFRIALVLFKCRSGQLRTVAHWCTIYPIFWQVERLLVSALTLQLTNTDSAQLLNSTEQSDGESVSWDELICIWK